jgi:dCMP deaminase
MQRIGVDQYFMVMAQVAALRSTCPRRQVGAVGVTGGKLVSSGFNGSVASLPHCTEVGCLMEKGSCIRTIHAEDNCLSQAEGRPIEVMYCLVQPCLACVKSMLAARVQLCLYWKPYPSEQRDRFLQGVGLFGDPSCGILGWMRQIECPDLAAGLTPGVSSLYGECAGDCGHVFSLDDQMPEGGFICPQCNPSGWNACAEGAGDRLAEGRAALAPVKRTCPACVGSGTVEGQKRFIGRPPLVTCDNCNGTGMVEVQPVVREFVNRKQEQFADRLAAWDEADAALVDPNGNIIPLEGEDPEATAARAARIAAVLGHVPNC